MRIHIRSEVSVGLQCLVILSINSDYKFPPNTWCNIFLWSNQLFRSRGTRTKPPSFSIYCESLRAVLYTYTLGIGVVASELSSFSYQRNRNVSVGYNPARFCAAKRPFSSDSLWRKSGPWSPTRAETVLPILSHDLGKNLVQKSRNIGNENYLLWSQLLVLSNHLPLPSNLHVSPVTRHLTYFIDAPVSLLEHTQAQQRATV